MKTIKTIIIVAELAAIICLGLTLYFCADDKTFNLSKAAIAGMFAISAVMLQGMNDGIEWNETIDGNDQE